jgi:hypothetical protein
VYQSLQRGILPQDQNEKRSGADAARFRPSPAVRLFQICRRNGHFSLAFPANPSDESSCANQAQKGFTTMTNAKATTTENAATVAEQGAHVAPEKASSKKGATQKKSGPKGQKAAKGGKSKASPKKEAKAGKKAKPAHAKEASTPRAESKGAKILALIGRPKGAIESRIIE